MNFHPLPRVSKYRVSIKFRNRNACSSRRPSFISDIFIHRSLRSTIVSGFSVFRTIFSNLHAIKIVLVSKFLKIHLLPFFFFKSNENILSQVEGSIEKKKKKKKEIAIKSFSRSSFSPPVEFIRRRLSRLLAVSFQRSKIHKSRACPSTHTRVKTCRAMIGGSEEDPICNKRFQRVQMATLIYE